uniref:RHO family interacting cell polarization regulator 1 n=1 Tax=Haplochromis burtoni TaxID=8153 RepID=A0A3Q2UZV4_HAPBU
MYSHTERTPSRTLSTMSLSIRPVRRLTSRSITRSQSFTGVNTHDKPYRNLVVFSTPGLSRKPSRASRLFTMSIKANPPPKVPQPERLDEVYEALKKGLQSYLQVHQMDLDTLTRQIKESKRNSRLGFLYELDKVSFFESFRQIEEFYESYCMQRRLRDGANKMVKAYTASSGSKEAKESLAEASKGYKEYTENMCVLENDFENQLGKFHIKMKGLAGFARLCAGDQYEVTELKSLANHVVVGSVSCETKDLFAALPQMVAVDINDLGTIKLSLEVTWNPFDKDDQGSVASTVNKPPSINKRISAIFDQTPPDTPPLRSSLLKCGELENGPAWSNSSESSDDSTSPQLPAHPKLYQHLIYELFCRHEEKGTVTVITKPDGEEEAAGKRSSMAPVDVPIITSSNSTLYLRSLSHISENSADGVVVPVSESGDVMSLVSGISINDIEMEVASRTPESPTSADTDTAVDVTDPHPVRKQHNTSTSVDTSAPLRAGADFNVVESGDMTYLALQVPVEEDIPASSSNCLSAKGDGPVDSGLEDALVAVLSSIDDYRGPFSELQLLEQELKLLQVTLKVRGGRHSRSPSVVSLTVETALGSFDFLNGSDWEEEEEDGDKRSRHGRSVLTNELKTSHPSLCTLHVLFVFKCLGKFGPLRCGEMYALDRLLREARVLEIIRRVTKENPQKIRPATEGLCLGAVSLWQECVGQGSMYSVSAERFLNTLSTIYAGLLPERAEAVFLCLVERVLDQRLPRRGSSRDNMMVTLFQLWSYLDSNAVSDMDTHIIELAKEVWLVQNLASSDQDVIVNALRRPAECSLRREGIHAVAKLLKDPRGKVSASASSVLRSLAAQPRQRKQALVSCLELLEDENVDNRVCGCKALACLKAKESIDQLVYLCRADKEEVRDAAKQTLLVLGEEGKMAHRHVETSQDSISRLFAPGSMASTAF